ncbi:pilus assembly protein TadG-related protein [uncultured Desulfosarcina sp.]|uniref:pilus assembly protein TadG-related protein n=1 Tax=uncultured Desulfosarcina sp. TaxID=218289 RepID=UPI0029C77B5D|nr:pilus assembly protein TadG-related protein [uncultured Desulfosarcina sp.]
MTPPHRILSNNRGAIALISVLVLSVLILVFALVLDTGFSFTSKSRIEQAVEAAAMAGAKGLCSGNAVAAAIQMAIDNGIEDAADEDVLTVVPGFYDENDSYEDFPIYRNFAVDPDSSTLENEAVDRLSGAGLHYDNAVLVICNKRIDSLSGGLLGQGSTTVSAAAVAFLSRKDLLTLDGDITVDRRFRSGYPLFRDTIIHANGDISFNGGETLEGETVVTATGQIENCPGACYARMPKVAVPPLEVVVEERRQLAEEAGTLVEGAHWPDDYEWHEAPFGWCRNRWGVITIAFTPGDHNGAVYFLAAEDESGAGTPVTSVTVHPPPDDDLDRAAWNFTLATDVSALNFKSPRQLYDNPIILGETAEKTVHFYSTETILFNPIYLHYQAYNYLFKGIVFRCKRFEHVWYSRSSDESRFQKIRVIAEEVSFTGRYASDPLLDGLFGPPCTPRLVHLAYPKLTDS